MKWDASSRQLTGTANLIGGEPMRIVLADNGMKPLKAATVGGGTNVEVQAAGGERSVLILDRPDNGRAVWRVEYQ